HVCAWLQTLAEAGSDAKADGVHSSDHSSGLAVGDREEFAQAVEFLFGVRCFLHYRHERDDNTLDWQAQDAAAAAAVGLARPDPKDRKGRSSPDAAYWMRLYFRNARVVERKAMQMLEEAPLPAAAIGRFARLAGIKSNAKPRKK